MQHQDVARDRHFLLVFCLRFSSHVFSSYALFTALLKPELRKLYNDNSLEEYNCYYKSNAVTRFDIRRNGRVWCEFTVTLTFPDSRPDGNYCVLATEDKEVVITEPEEGLIVFRI